MKFHPSNREPFATIAVALGSRVSPKLRAKIWANEFIDFWTLLTSSPNQDRFSVCLTPSPSSSSQPCLTLEPCQPSKKIHTFLQWLSAFNTFVAIFSEKFPNETPRLMKYSEIVRDISTKPGDWYFYDGQFHYIRPSAPDQYPWDTIHWELWIKAVINFRAKPTQPKSDMVSPCTRPRQSFPKGTCWSFHVSRFFGGCKFEHVCFKCGAKHPASQCSTVNQQRAAPPRINQVLHSRPVMPAKVDRVEYLLNGYPASLQKYLVSGFSCGFCINFVGERYSFESPNLKGALEQPKTFPN